MAREEGAEHGRAVEGSCVLVEEFKTQFLSPKAIAVDGNGNVYVGCSGFQGGLEKFIRPSSGDGFVAAWKFGEKGKKNKSFRRVAHQVQIPAATAHRAVRIETKNKK